MKQKRLITALLTVFCAAQALPPAIALTIKPGTSWDTLKIPVCWEDTSRGRKQERDLIRKSVLWTWERESAIRFTGWRGCRPTDTGIRISFDSTYPRTAGRGSELRGATAGVQLPTLWSLAALSINMKAPVHEFGHVLGFGHEYARRDVADPERCGASLNGARYIEDDTPLTPYDEQSIMVGCRPGATAKFSSGVPTLSAGDIFGLVQTYGSNPDNVLDRDESGDLFGSAILARDLDGDGVTDLAVGAPGEDEGRGAVYLYKGDRKKGLRPWTAIAAPALALGFGSSLPAAVQVSGTDGKADTRLAISEVGRDNRTYSFLLSQPDQQPSLTQSEIGQESVPVPVEALALQWFRDPLGARAGEAWSVAVADLDADGIDDAVVGAPFADVKGHTSGAVIVFRGQSDGTFTEWYWFGQSY